MCFPHTLSNVIIPPYCVTTTPFNTCINRTSFNVCQKKSFFALEYFDQFLGSYLTDIGEVKNSSLTRKKSREPPWRWLDYIPVVSQLLSLLHPSHIPVVSHPLSQSFQLRKEGNKQLWINPNKTKPMQLFITEMVINQIGYKRVN